MVCWHGNIVYSSQTYGAYDTKRFICLFKRAVKMIEKGVYFIVIVLLIAELFKVLIYAN